MYNRWHIIKPILIIAEGLDVIARRLRHLAMVLQRCIVLLVRGGCPILKILAVEYLRANTRDVALGCSVCSVCARDCGQRGL
jgi:hypothetical protein